jgi:hypothetical protein
MVGLLGRGQNPVPSEDETECYDVLPLDTKSIRRGVLVYST